MIRTIRFELIKLWQRRTVLIALAVTAIFAIGSAVLIVHAAKPARPGPDQFLTLDQLAAPGGGTDVFGVALSFAGFFVLVRFTSAVAAEFPRGTVRTMVLRQPDRLRLLAGKLAALLVSAAGLLAIGEVLSFVTTRAVAPGRGVDTSQWLSLDAGGDAVAVYGRSLFWVTGYALLGTALAVVVRSVPIALAIGIGWAGPFEHIVEGSWSHAGQVFPGLLLETFVTGGRDGVSTGQALATSAVYAALAAAVAATAFTRRDVA